jgi:Mn2+/Fe2+ NRAMP family transporter
MALQVANAMLLPLVLVLMRKLVDDRLIMESWINKRVTNAIVTVLAVLVSIATLALFVSGGDAGYDRPDVQGPPPGNTAEPPPCPIP